MATFVFTDASLVINSVDLSNRGIQLAVDIGVELMDDTVFGHTARTASVGLKTGAAQITFLQDYAASSVDATMFPLIGNTGFTFVWKPTSAAVSASNPSYTATMVLESYAPTGDGVGDQAKATANLVNAGVAGWARATA